MANIHPTSIVQDGAKLGENVTIGPFCLVGAEVVLDDDVHLRSHVVVEGETRIGAGTVVHANAVLGGAPQSVRHGGGKSALTIGRNCTIREGVTISCGTDGDLGITTVGDNCFLMANAHIAHDCVVGNGVTLINNVMLAGHVWVGDAAILGGGAAIHQFSRIGKRAFVGGMTGIEGDLIPYGMAIGERAYLTGLNLVGLKRAGFQRSDIRVLQEALTMLFEQNRPVTEMIDEVRTRHGSNAAVQDILEFIENRRKRGLLTPQLRTSRPISEDPAA